MSVSGVVVCSGDGFEAGEWVRGGWARGGWARVTSFFWGGGGSFFVFKPRSSHRLTLHVIIHGELFFFGGGLFFLFLDLDPPIA